MDQGLCAKILDCIDASTHIEFHWGKDRTLIGHTSIAVKFNGEPKYTLDFGPSEAQSGTLTSAAQSSKASAAACVALALNKSIFVNGFEFSKNKIERQLLEFAIDTVTGESRAVNLFLELSRIEMGEYHYRDNLQLP